MATQLQTGTTDLRQIQTLSQAVRYFVTCAGPMTMVAFLVVAIALRVYSAVPIGWADVVAIAGTVLLWWFQEWALHITVLHMKPRRIVGVSIDPAFSRTHRAHHREPWHPVKVFVPLVYVVLGFLVAAILLYLILPWSLALTALVAYCAMGVLYEWTHFLVHTRYKPRTAFVRALWRNHRLHHFKNENYWFGLSVTWVDDVLGTAPDHSAVETSATCRMPETEFENE